MAAHGETIFFDGEVTLRINTQGTILKGFCDSIVYAPNVARNGAHLTFVGIWEDQRFEVVDIPADIGGFVGSAVGINLDVPLVLQIHIFLVGEVEPCLIVFADVINILDVDFTHDALFLIHHLQFRFEAFSQIGVHAELDVASAIVLDGTLPFFRICDRARHCLESNLATSEFTLLSILHSRVFESEVHDLVHHLNIFLVNLVILLLGLAEILPVDVLNDTLQGA